MKYNKLGTTDIDVSVICLGTMTWGEQNTESEGHEQMSYALDQGVNFWDTAELYSVPARKETYGSTETIIGSWFKKNGKRDEVILASKIAGPGAYTTHIRDVKDYSKQSIAEAVEGSLKRLQTDYIDLYQVHWPARPTNFFGTMNYRHRDGWQDNFQEILEGMDAMVKEGKIRHFGISNETPWGLNNYLKISREKNLPRCMTIQNPYSLLNRTFEVGLAEIAVREHAGLLAYSPMAFGLLSGKYHKKQDKPTNRINKFEQMARYNSTQSWDATAKYLALAEEHGLSLAQMSLAFINQQPFVTANIIGATNLDQLKENIDSANVTLSKDVIKSINAIHSEIPNPAP